MKNLLLFILVPFLSFGQTQIGDDIDGEATEDVSGRNVSISGDGSIIAIGAIGNDGNGENSGHVRVFENIENNWMQLGDDIDGEISGDYSGKGLSLSSDGSTVAIGARSNGNGQNSGHVRVFRYENSSWEQLGDDIDGETESDFFGYSISLSGDGNTVAIGTPFTDQNGLNAGHVRVFENISGNWQQVGETLSGEGSFNGLGESVSISIDGNTLGIGARQNANSGFLSEALVFKNINNSWVQLGDTIVGETPQSQLLENYISLSGDGNSIVIGITFNENETGQAGVYEYINENWEQKGETILGESSTDVFGERVTISNNGNVIAISAAYNDGNGQNSGQVRIFQYIGAMWQQIGNEIFGEAAFNYFGFDISLLSDVIGLIVGASLNSDSGANAGHARVFDISEILSNNTTISEENSIIYPNPTSNRITVKLDDNIIINTITIYNTLGQIVQTETKSSFDISALATGSYYIQVTTNEGVATQNLLVK